MSDEKSKAMTAQDFVSSVRDGNYHPGSQSAMIVTDIRTAAENGTTPTLDHSRILCIRKGFASSSGDTTKPFFDPEAAAVLRRLPIYGVWL